MKKIINEIIGNLGSKPEGIIGIDGHLGAGKSKIAIYLSNFYEIPLLHVDDYLSPGQDAYFEAVKYGDLKLEIFNAKKPLIVEGVCLLEVLDKINTVPNHFFFIPRAEITPYVQQSKIVTEVDRYVVRNETAVKASIRRITKMTITNQLDVDIAYLKAKTISCVTLAVGGISALVAGTFIVSMGMGTGDSASFDILGATVSAEGIGSITLASSVLWAYFAYKAKPNYSSRSEKQTNNSADGSSNSYEFRSSTMAISAPKNPESPPDKPNF